jgi:hypothetical protein
MVKQKKTRKFAEVCKCFAAPSRTPDVWCALTHNWQVKRMISPKDERLNFKEKGSHPRIRRVSFMTFWPGKTAPEKRMKDKELLKIPKQVRDLLSSAPVVAHETIFS